MHLANDKYVREHTKHWQEGCNQSATIIISTQPLLNSALNKQRNDLSQVLFSGVDVGKHD